MINEIRSTVMSILNKNNYGYISPADFNLYAKQAQLSIFLDYFNRYNNAINKENARVSGTDYADLSKGVAESIDYFSLTNDLAHVSANSFTMPSDLYVVNKVLYYDGSKYTEMEKASKRDIIMLRNSLDLSPSTIFPVYELMGNTLTAYPNTINTLGDVVCDYVRYPLTPKWTYNTIGAEQAPIFNQSAVDYQDFEISEDEYPELVYRILQLAGMSIREAEVYRVAQSEQLEEEK